MKCKAIIFDMDGTIVDTNPIWNKTVVQLALRKGITDPQLHKKIQDAICGLSVTPACKLIKELSALPDSLDQIMQEKMEIALSLYEETSKT
jgi:beta-phosphoglucomutase-like phosphatase (HAD superfamily)